MVPPASDRVPRVRSYSGVICVRHASSTGILPSLFGLSRPIRLTFFNRVMMIRNPIVNYGLASSPFARRYLENRVFFLFLKVLRCFSSLRYLHAAMYLLHDTQALPWVSSLIRKSAGQQICAPHRSLSQLITSFFGSQCQGILPMLFVLDHAWLCVKSGLFLSSLLYISLSEFWFLSTNLTRNYLPIFVL